ncbi:MAG: hypothetical protein EU539_01290 [Promethearchaeota archaeon]|nr:MAG: hypothetical protein EU539_01290 [Candidatus Lokiarchaeota archaeon]
MKVEPITHECTSDDLEWNESYYLAFYNKDHDMGGVSRIGFKPNKPEGMTFLFLFLPDNSAAGYFKINKAKKYSEKLKVGGMIHEYQSNGIWNYKFKGTMIFVNNSLDLPKVREETALISKTERVTMDLRFQPINEVYEYSQYMTKESLDLGRKAGDKHWEQIAEINGQIQIGNDIYQIKNTIGQRDHTYGIRDWTGVGNWFYYVIWFNKNLAINPAAIIGDDGRLSTGGFLFKDGRNIPLKTLRIVDQKFQTDNIFPVSSELEIIDYDGEMHVLKAQVGPIIPIPFEDKEGNKAILVQSFGDFELDGLSGGYGTFETLRRIS